MVNGPISPKKLAEHLGLGHFIPQATRERIKAAAKKFIDLPSFLAGSPRNRGTLAVGIMVPELRDGYHTQVMSGIGDQLTEAGYFYFIAHHRHRKDLIERHSRLLLSRGSEALIAIDTTLEHPFPVPVAAVAGHRPIRGVTNVVLNHRLAAEHALRHLHSLGHRRIVFMRGQPFSSDSEDRWHSIAQVAREMSIPIEPKLVVQLERDINSPELGYPEMRGLLATRTWFTAVVAFNDMSAIGAIRALQDFGLSVPHDVSVIGFDDINAAAFNNPRLTTIRQPLAQMGKIAAQCVLNQLHARETFREQITIEPGLIVRESTHTARSWERSESRKPPRTARKANVIGIDAGRA